MADSTVTTTVGLGAIGTVLAILTASTRMNLKQLAAANAALSKMVEQRELDKDRLNKALLAKGEKLGELQGVEARAQQLKSDYDALLGRYEKLDDDYDALKLAHEVQSLDNVGLRQRIVRLEEQLKERGEKDK